MRPLFTILALLAMFSTAFAVLEIPNAQPKVHANEWKWVLDSTWQGLKKRNIEACRDKPIYRQNPTSPGGLICRPKSETPYDAVSEGIGYGMLLALYSNDQETFDLIYNAGKEFSLNFCEGWRKPADGGNTASGSATDADEDIAIALIFADKLQKKEIWGSSTINYANDAQSAVNCVWGSMKNGLLCPGGPNGGWCPGYNLGYFAPAWYRIFKDFDSNKSRDWQKAINESYNLIEHNKNPGYSIGMVPDWSAADGSPGGGGYNTYMSGKAFFKDAIRVLWRIANDAIWFNEPRAKEFLTKSLAFIKDKGGPDAANFYQLEGQNKGKLLPDTDKWNQFNDESNPNTWRYRREHSWLTVGQWITAVMAVGTDEDKVAWSKKMAEFYEYDVNKDKNYKPDFFGLKKDPTKGNYETSRYEDTTHNEMYFDQFLAWFGVSLMSGTWVNVVELLDNPVANDEGIPGSPFPSLIEPIIAKNNVRLGIQITQAGNALRLQSKNDVTWKIHNLQGKLLFSSNSKEATWNAGHFKGTAVVSAASGSGLERKLAVVK
jgi:endo-1,4-beta-D-glucanase Y